MKSPITGKEMSLKCEWKVVSFRKELFEVPYQYYLCEDTGEQFTTTALDEMNIQMVHNQYRVKNHVPLPEEIQAIREKYEVSASRMGEILGFGPNTYGQYEKGDLPSMANSKLIRMADDPIKFKDIVEDWETTSDNAKAELKKRIQRLIKDKNPFDIDLESYFMGGNDPSEFTGFKTPDFDKLSEMIVFFAQEVSCYKTKMNKLLFYADFANFRQCGHSISGGKYKAIPYGPVPNSFESIFETLARQDVIDLDYEELPEGGQKQFLKGRLDRPFNKEKFSERELTVLYMVKEKFKKTKPSEIVQISHKEKAWTENEKSRSFISYSFAFELKGV